MGYMVYGNLTLIYPKPYSIYLRGDYTPEQGMSPRHGQELGKSHLGQGLGFRGSGFRGLGFGVWGLGFRG